MNTYNAIQLWETARTEPDARQMLDGLALQSGYLGGRIMEPHPARLDCPTAWIVQAFFKNDADPAAPLGDGLRRVLILDCQRAALLGAK